MEKEPPGELMEFLSRYPIPIVETFLAVRDWVREFVPEASENVLSVSYTVSSGYTFTHSIKQAFLYIAAFQHHVNLGFPEGALLSDPDGRLLGDGKSMRHIKFRSPDQLGDPVVDDLLRRCIAAAHRPETPLEPITMVSPKKKPS